MSTVPTARIGPPLSELNLAPEPAGTAKARTPPGAIGTAASGPASVSRTTAADPGPGLKTNTVVRASSRVLTGA